MAPPFADDDCVMSTGGYTSTTAVAIDKDKNSQYAVKWTIDNLMNTIPHLILIHITRRFLQNQGLGLNESNLDAYRESNEDILRLFLPYREYCSSKGIQIKEVVIDDFDVSKALIGYLNGQCINNIVVGASTRNVITRKFMNPDVATCLTKHAPDFSTVYVISKGKVLAVRSATEIPALNGINGNGLSSPIQLQSPQRAFPQSPQRAFRQSPQRAFPQLRVPENSDLEGSWRGTGAEKRVMKRSLDLMITLPPRNRNTANNLSIENLDLSVHVPRISYGRDSDSDCSLGFQSIDIDSDILKFNIGYDISPNTSPRNSTSSQSSRNIEAEMKSLKLELKQAMDLYSSACKEAIAAKQKARELHQWKMEKSPRFEEARLAEEAALAIAEMERAKCRAAIESAETAQKVADKETNRRRYAELKAKHEAAERMRTLFALQNNDIRYRRYDIDEIKAATDFFTQSLKIGEGGYGPVYKALLDHTPVAIKVLRPDAHQGRQQFQQEVEVLCSIRHPNMVLLLGACPEYGCLVYEYMENGSLEDRLFRKGNSPTIPWWIRFKIAAEIATGLLFLHQTKPEPLVHRDLKPANILLDHNYVSKISDVGLARLVPSSVADSVTQYRMTSAAGTFCYIDPEYQQTGMLGIKSDVYSLGIMLLQIITAMPAMGLSHQVEKAIEDGNFGRVLDPMVPDWPVQEALEYAKVALKCAELRRKDRPDLGSVVLPILNRLRNLACEVESKIYSPRPPSCNIHSQSISRFSKQELMRSNLIVGIQRRSLSQENGRDSSPRPVIGGVRLLPRRLVASVDAPE